jgi:two-component sensor histidine kinase
MLIHMSSVARVPQNASDLRAEADHRIANSLQMIASLIRKRATTANSTTDPRTFLLEMATRVDAIGILHRLIAKSTGDSIQLSEFLTEICNRLSSTLATDGSAFSVACSPEHSVPFEVAGPIGLITAEFFSNAVKYAHPTGMPVTITLTCSRSRDGRLTIVLEDDGVGFPEGFDVEHDGSIGTQIIRLLAHQLCATYHWHSDSLGVRLSLSLPA